MCGCSQKYVRPATVNSGAGLLVENGNKITVPTPPVGFKITTGSPKITGNGPGYPEGSFKVKEE